MIWYRLLLMRLRSVHERVGSEQFAEAISNCKTLGITTRWSRMLCERLCHARSSLTLGASGCHSTVKLPCGLQLVTGSVAAAYIEQPEAPMYAGPIVDTHMHFWDLPNGYG